MRQGIDESVEQDGTTFGESISDVIGLSESEAVGVEDKGRQSAGLGFGRWAEGSRHPLEGLRNSIFLANSTRPASRDRYDGGR